MTIPKNDRSSLYHYESGGTRICGRFQINAGAVVDIEGRGFGVGVTAPGDYLVTVTDGFSEIVSATATVENAANNVDMYAQIGAITVGVAGAVTVQIRTKTIGANTAIPNDDWCSFEIVLRSEWLDAV